MFLEKLEIQGFKSFAQKATLEFDKGMTAIVGPNGSGKSNIAEAIRWVLGEQSMKALRSRKSEDVIFAGTHKKARLGMAEASLYLNNENGKAEVDYDSLVITRRVFRDGESEYLINKNKVRLLDLQQLLAKLGFGQKTYSVIGQGMIDGFLRASPRERKELFEEAAGVKQYQLKRDLSLNKLEQTRQNLMRVKDHLDELLPRLRSLKRQAGRARRKSEVEKELKYLQGEYFNHAWNEIVEKEKAILNKMESVKAEVAKGRENLKNKEDLLLEVVKGTTFRQSKEEEEYLNSLHNEKNKLKEKLAILSGRVQIEKEKNTSYELQNLLKQKEEKNQEKENANLNLKNLKENIKNLNDNLEKEIKEHKETLSKIQKLQEELLPKSQLSPDFFEIEKQIEEIFSGEERIIQRLEQIKNPNELKAIIILAKEYTQKLKKLLERTKEERKKARKETKEEGKNQTPAEEIKKFLLIKEKEEKEISEYKIRLAVLQTKEDFFGEQIKSQRQVQEEIENQLRKIEVKGENVEIQRLEKEREEIEGKLRDALAKIKESEDKVKTRTKSEEGSRQKILDFENEYKNTQEVLDKIKDGLRETEIQKTKTESEKTFLFGGIKDNFGEAKAKQICEEFFKNPKKLSDNQREEFKEKIERLRKQFIQIGEIDSQTISECGECEKRYNFLALQKEDLEKAIISLKEVIKELEGKININFDQAIKEIAEQFQKYFTILFSGGKAKLLKKKYDIEKEKVPLGENLEISFSLPSSRKEKDEFYIEIRVTPPGKKLKDLNMLSGGEKALTSIALILAIITYNPSPFIVLDEVDAALDEANSSRYAKIIEDVAQKTQFVTITHNRETMRKAKVLYGVTMEESGISKLLSIGLEKVTENLTS